MSRLMADILVVKLGQSRFTFGTNTLRSSNEARATYIEALQAADQHDLGKLIAFLRS